MSTFVKILLGVAVISAQALDINATQHILGPPYNGRENEFLAHPFVHPNGYAEAWAGTLASDGLQYLITHRWNENVQSALWSARALSHLNAALQVNAQIRQFNAAQAPPPAFSALQAPSAFSASQSPPALNAAQAQPPSIQIRFEPIAAEHP